MNTNRCGIITQSAILLLLVMPIAPTQATRSDPDAVIYGQVEYNGALVTAASEGVEVVAKRAGSSEELARYQYGEWQTADNYYLLRLPMDSLNPQATGTVNFNDAIDLYLVVDNAEQQLGTTQIAERGSYIEVDLGANISNLKDSDNDGHADAVDNCKTLANSNQIDSDGDGYGDACDAFRYAADEWLDSDGDGIGDNFDVTPNSYTSSTADENNNGIADLAEFNYRLTTPPGSVAADEDIPFVPWWMLLGLGGVLARIGGVGKKTAKNV